MPDAVVLDVMIPDRDGFDGCEGIKSDPALRQIPVLLLTAVASKMTKTKDTPRMDVETEAEDYIHKPLKPEEIAARVERLLRK